MPKSYAREKYGLFTCAYISLSKSVKCIRNRCQSTIIDLRVQRSCCRPSISSFIIVKDVGALVADKHPDIDSGGCATVVRARPTTHGDGGGFPGESSSISGAEGGKLIESDAITTRHRTLVCPIYRSPECPTVADVHDNKRF